MECPFCHNPKANHYRLTIALATNTVSQFVTAPINYSYPICPTCLRTFATIPPAALSTMLTAALLTLIECNTPTPPPPQGEPYPCKSTSTKPKPTA